MKKFGRDGKRERLGEREKKKGGGHRVRELCNQLVV